MSEEPPQDPQSTRNGIVFLSIVVEGGLVFLAIVAGWLLGQPPLSRFQLDIHGVLSGLLAAVPMVGAFLVMTTWPIGPFRKIKEFTEEVIRPMMAPCSLVDLLGISCLAGLGEEMLFRGCLQDWLGTWTPLWVAVVVASALFGLFHPITISYTVLAALLGAYLGWVYVLTGNLLAPIIAHAAYDFVVLVYLLQEAEPPIEEEAEDDSQP
jgi:hypothetical protein